MRMLVVCVLLFVSGAMLGAGILDLDKDPVIPLKDAQGKRGRSEMELWRVYNIAPMRGAFYARVTGVKKRAPMNPAWDKWWRWQAEWGPRPKEPRPKFFNVREVEYDYLVLQRGRVNVREEQYKERTVCRAIFADVVKRQQKEKDDRIKRRRLE